MLNLYARPAEMGKSERRGAFVKVVLMAEEGVGQGSLASSEGENQV